MDPLIQKIDRIIEERSLLIIRSIKLGLMAS